MAKTRYTKDGKDVIKINPEASGNLLNGDGIMPNVVRVFNRARLEFTPEDTGNLKYNAWELYIQDLGSAVISINESIAPYMPYTNEPWIAARWNGAINPNEGWWDKTVEQLAKWLAEALGGRMEVIND